MSLADFSWNLFIWVIGSCISGGLINKFLIAKQKHTYSKEIERLRNKLESHSYTSRVKFDLKIQIYNELIVKICALEDACTKLFPPITNLQSCGEDIEERPYIENKKLYASARKSLDDFITKLNCTSIFIPESIYTNFKLIYWKCKEQVDAIERHLHGYHLQGQEYDDCYKSTDEIHKGVMDIREELRNHIDKMEISLLDK